MKIIRGRTNHDVFSNLDVFLDGQLLDSEHYGVIEADDVTGYVKYLMFERAPEGRHDVVIEETNGDMRRKVFVCRGKVELRDRVFMPMAADLIL